MNLLKLSKCVLNLDAVAYYKVTPPDVTPAVQAHFPDGGTLTFTNGDDVAKLVRIFNQADPEPTPTPTCGPGIPTDLDAEGL